MKDDVIRHLSIDSRKAFPGNGALFFCLRGPHHDGHAFISEAYAKGWRMFVTEQEPDEGRYPEASFFVTANSLEALQSTAAKHRVNYTYPVIGITGSNGKTIVKEWLYQLCFQHYSVVKSPKSYNSQVGVPLSVWAMNEGHSLAIFEAGISEPGEMEKLERIIQPNIGIFTNLGSAHDAAFPSLEKKLLEKAKLFENCKKLIYCADHAILHAQLKQALPKVNLVSWGSQNASYQVTLEEESISVAGPAGRLQLAVPFRDPKSIENMCHCIVTALEIGIPAASIQAALQAFREVPMRLTLLNGSHGSVLVDDSYNNDLAGLGAALDFLRAHSHGKRQTVILSDILQSRGSLPALYAAVNRILEGHGVKKLVGIGPEISQHAGQFSIEADFFPDTASFLKARTPLDFAGQAILIKGARSFGFENIVRRFQLKMHRSVLEINLEALQHNFQYYRSKLAPGVKTMVMLKAFAYGSGSGEIGRTLQYLKADYIAVAFADEGVQLRQEGVQIPIMVLNASPDSFDQLYEYSLEPEIFSFGQLSDLVKWTQPTRQLAVHIKLDTGMHRLGFVSSEWKKLGQLLKKAPDLKVASIFSHLAASESKELDYFTLEQVQEFLKAYEDMVSMLGYQPLRHILNTAGIDRFPDYHLDMVRIGIGLHGLASTAVEKGQLRPVATLKTVVSQVKHLQAGDTVGYGRNGMITQPVKIATIAIGYADGFSRLFGNGNGKVLINGRLFPTIGHICMDMAMVNVGDSDVEEGDEVTIFGEYPSVADLAGWAGTIPYEILTSVSERIKREYVAG